MTIDNAKEAATYGNLSRVAMNFYIAKGQPMELHAAVCYARAAAYWANRAIDGIDWNPPVSTCIETLEGNPDTAIRLSSQIRVF